MWSYTESCIPAFLFECLSSTQCTLPCFGHLWLFTSSKFTYHRVIPEIDIFYLIEILHCKIIYRNEIKIQIGCSCGNSLHVIDILNWYQVFMEIGWRVESMGVRGGGQLPSPRWIFARRTFCQKLRTALITVSSCKTTILARNFKKACTPSGHGLLNLINKLKLYNFQGYDWHVSQLSAK